MFRSARGRPQLLDIGRGELSSARREHTKRRGRHSCPRCGSHDMTADVATRVQDVFRDVFDDPELNISDSMTARDVDGWDSLKHIDLIVALEQAFRVRFTTSEVTRLRNVGEL